MPTESEFFAVIRTVLRGQRVEVWMRDGDGPEQAEVWTVGDVYAFVKSPSVKVAWTLTLDEVAALEDVLTAP